MTLPDDPLDGCAVLIVLGEQAAGSPLEEFDLDAFAVHHVLAMATTVSTYFGPFAIDASLPWFAEAYHLFLQKTVTIDEYLGMVMRGGLYCPGAQN